MPQLIYSTGTVTIAANGTVVTAVSGAPLWNSNVMAFDTLMVAGYGPVKILGVTDDTHLTIAAWPYAAVTSAPYQIIQDSVLRFNGAQVSADVVELVGALDVDGFFIFVGAALSVPDPSKGDEGQWAYQPSTSKQWLKTGGVWVYQGIVCSFTGTAWTSGTTYPANALVPYQGKIWLSLQAANTGNNPASSPAWWQSVISGGDAFDIGSYDTDRPADGEQVLKWCFTKTVTFYAGLPGSQAQASTGATATAVYHFYKNGTAFATLTFAAGGSGGPQTGTFASAADTVFNAGDILTAIAPSARDATLANIAWDLSGYRSP